MVCFSVLFSKITRRQRGGKGRSPGGRGGKKRGMLTFESRLFVSKEVPKAKVLPSLSGRFDFALLKHGLPSVRDSGW